jgi:hypothetical protein
MQDALTGAIGEGLGCKLPKKRDWVVIEFPPPNRIDIPEKMYHFWMPTPPQIGGDRHAFLINKLWPVQNRYP